MRTNSASGRPLVFHSYRPTWPSPSASSAMNQSGRPGGEPAGLLAQLEQPLLLLGGRLLVGLADFPEDGVFLVGRQLVQPAEFKEDLLLAVRRRLLVLPAEFLQHVLVDLERRLVRL